MAATPTDSRRLVLVRHAKAVGSSGGGDRTRPLTDQGRVDAGTAGGWLAPRVTRLDALWSSSALRARQTTEAICSRLSAAPEAEWRDDLYDAGVGDLLDLLRTLPDPARAVLVVGHNPTVEAAQATLTGDARGFRAGAAAIVEIGCSWSELDAGTGRVVDFFAP